VRGIGFVVYPVFSVMVLSIVNVFEIANTVAGSPPYELHFLSEKGGKVKTSSGMMLESEAFTDMPFDTLIVSAARLPKPSTPGMISFLREAPKRHRRIAAICTGAFLLAEAGLLNGRQATTHWLHAPKLRKLFPKVKIDQDRIFTNDGSIWTTAGGAACLDLGLALIENDLGAELARFVARELIIYHRRGGGQSQFSALLEMSQKSDRIQMALTYARENLHKSLTVPELAEAARLSPRQFSRAFQAETGLSPAKAIENLRVEAARILMEQSRHPIDVVARQSGFSHRDHMRRAFVRAFGQPRQALRRMARAPSH
jgi:transcriptional regulator GlxA family with amidase domain